MPGHYLKMCNVTSTKSPHIVCSSMIKCGGDGNNETSKSGSSALWYSCPLCSHRLCATCALVKMENQPSMNEYTNGYHKTMDEKHETKIDMGEWNEEKRSGSAPIPGMVN